MSKLEENAGNREIAHSADKKTHKLLTRLLLRCSRAEDEVHDLHAVLTRIAIIANDAEMQKHKRLAKIERLANQKLDDIDAVQSDFYEH